MTPDKKYMSEVNLEEKDIKFVSLSEINRKFSDNKVNEGDRNLNLDLFSSETGLPKLCYYSNESKDIIDEDSYINTAKDISSNNFNILKDLDLELDKTKDNERVYSNEHINRLYLEIERRNPGIFAAFYSYRIPKPISRAIVKHLIKLTLSYCDKN